MINKDVYVEKGRSRARLVKNRIKRQETIMRNL